jgi:hypothetical protein
MDAWTSAVAAIALMAITAPLVIKKLRKQDPERQQKLVAERREVIADVERLLGGIATALDAGETVRVGAGSSQHEEVARLRQRVRAAFPLSVSSAFDREIGYELNRAGVFALTAVQLRQRRTSAEQVLREAVEG